MAEVRNLGEVDAEDFSIKIIVPKYMQIQQKPISENLVLARGQNVVTQLFRLRNNSGGEKETVVRLYVMCRLGEMDVYEVSQVEGIDDW